MNPPQDRIAGSIPHHDTFSEVDTRMPPGDKIPDQESDDNHTASHDHMVQMAGLIDTTTTLDLTYATVRNLGANQVQDGIMPLAVDPSNEVGTVLQFQNTGVILLDVQGGYRCIHTEHVIHLMTHRDCHWSSLIHPGHKIKIITQWLMIAILTRVVNMKIWN
ncbi:hypothetical protein BGZ81_010042 [Podila clonocystis]|nr:hypothetical protein BGZ81_010042 [Podila clonocystis]